MLQKPNIGKQANLSEFIKSYPNTEMMKQLKILEQSFPTYRAIRGDGNCFYRAFAFLYLSNSKVESFRDLFPETEWICKSKEPLPINSENFSKELLKYWQKNIKPLSNVLDSKVKEAILQKLFNQQPDFDTLMIGYLKSVNYWHLKRNSVQFLPYFDEGSTLEDNLTRISTFDQESEGVEIFTLSQFFKKRIIIFSVDKNHFQPVIYGEEYQNAGYYFFYRPGHYDIVYPEILTQNDPILKQSVNATSYLKANHHLKAKGLKQRAPTPQKLSSEQNKKTLNQQPKKSRMFESLFSRKEPDTTKSEQKKETSDQDANEPIYISTKVEPSGKYDVKYNSKTPTQALPVNTKNRAKVISDGFGDFHRLFIELVALGVIFGIAYAIYKHV